MDMIFDAHTHLARAQDVYGDFVEDGRRAWGESHVAYCSPEMHREAMGQCDGAIVLALDAPFVGYVSGNELVADYVRTDPERLFGFASVDPNREDALQRLRHAVLELGLKGLKLGPIYQNFSPHDTAAQPLYAFCEAQGIPILWHQGTSFVRRGPLDVCNPVLLDQIASSYPKLQMVIAHMGHPWYAETACVVRKHPNVYADISALACRPWQFYNIMMCAIEYGITDKLFFGTDLPSFDVSNTLKQVRAICSITQGTRLPRVPEETIEAIIGRDTPAVLGLR